MRHPSSPSSSTHVRIPARLLARLDELADRFPSLTSRAALLTFAADVGIHALAGNQANIPKVDRSREEP